MFSTRITYLFILTLICGCLVPGKLSSQEVVLFDTLDYLPMNIEGALENNLMIAASKGNVREIERLISKGADIDAETYEGATALIFAVVNNRLAAVKSLLAHSPDVNKMTANNETPLLISVKNQSPEIAEALIRGGAEIDLADKFGVTPLHYAAISGSFIMADLLLYYEADCNKKSNDGTTPLMASIWAGFSDITDLLFQSGANLEARDNNGFTPFLIASQNGDTMVMNLLLKEGVDLYEKNNYNYNALAVAIESNQKPAIELLLEKGDQWTSPDKEGVNPYTVASVFGRKDVIEMLEKKNISGRQGWQIEEVSVSVSSRINARDYFTGSSISFREPLINAGFIVGFDMKPTYTKVLLELGENTYYQYFDRSSLVYAGIFKDYTLSEKLSKLKFVISASLSIGYSFSSEYRGTNIHPENMFRIIPAAGIKVQKGHFSVKADLEYVNTQFYRIGPFWGRIGIAYNHLLSRIKRVEKTIKWY